MQITQKTLKTRRRVKKYLQDVGNSQVITLVSTEGISYL